MVQGISPEQQRSHGGVDRPDLHQDTSSSRVGADLEKKLKKVRSMKISGFDSLQNSPTMDFQFKKTAFSSIRNYMKPTRSSDARKGKLKATVTSPAITDKKKKKKMKNSFMDSSSSSSSPAASVKKNLNRATCSSTLKDSKFPAALVINSEGKSKMRVCPYTYCSLNGHMHELSSSSSIPLKCFISERRRILRNQRSMDIETLFSVKSTRDYEEEERVGEERVSEIIEIPSDLFAGICYTMPPEEIIGEEIKYSEINSLGENCAFDESWFDDEGKVQEDYEFEENGDEAEHVSEEEEFETERSSPETANIFEYVEVDDDEKAHEDYEFEENGDGKNADFKSTEMDCEAEHVSEKEDSETEHSSPEKTANILEYVEVEDEEKAQEDYEFEDNGDARKSYFKSIDMDCEAEHVSEEEESETEQSSPETANILEYVEIDSVGKAQEDYELEENGDGKNSDIESIDMDCEAEHVSEKVESETGHSSPETATIEENGDGKKADIESFDMDCEAEEEESETEHSSPEDESGNLEAINWTPETMVNETGGIPSSKWNITRKKKTEELEPAKEFNPKQPNFLPLEPDPEDEKVDLRHQMMDGRKSAEEWMIDYALQNAVTRLGDRARKKKKKVALLVEAFETVVPLHTCETPVRHGTSSFGNLSFIQACS